MARVNHKKVKQLIQERRGKISDREFFTSRLLALHFEDIAAAQTKRYGSRRPVRVHLTWEPDASHAACTNNLTIHINAGNSIITQFPTREERYQMVCGLFAHELGHCLYTDFLASQTYGQEISACRWYPEPPALPTIKDRVNERALWDYAQAEPENLPLLARVAHEVGNVLEDAYIENRILEVFPGTLGQSLDFLRAWQWNDMPTVTQLKEREAQGQPVFFSLLQLFLSYGKFGELKANADQLAMGHLLEPIAAHWFEKKTGNLVEDDTFLYQHADHPYALANIDRRYTRREDGEPGVLECKSCTYHKAGDWAEGAIPLHYELQLRFYLAVLDVEYGAFSCIWGNNPETDLAMPEIIRDKAKEDMIFERLDQWIWSLEHDKPPTMEDIKPKLALESLARIYGASKPGLPTVEFPGKYEHSLRQIAQLQENIAACNQEIKAFEKEVEAHSVRIAELMKEHEHGVLATTKDKLLIDFVTRTTKRPDSKALKEKYPTVYTDVLKTSESRKLKVHIEPA